MERNYFKLFEQPEQLTPDREVIRKTYYVLSRQYHPDRLAHLGAEAQAEGLEKAALLNEAYRTLTDPDATMAYVLRQQGVLEDEEQYKLPADFLMEMMELNELMDDGAEPARMKRAMDEQLSQWELDVRGLVEEYNAGGRQQDLLMRLKDAYFRKKYLLRIQERIDSFGALPKGGL